MVIVFRLVVLVLARYQAKASYPRSCGLTNNALLPTRYCKHIVHGRYTFLFSFDSATDSSGGAWFARANSEHTTFYNRTVLFDVSKCYMTGIFFDTQTVFNVPHPNHLVYFHLFISPTVLTRWCTNSL